jgi:hypothetical protein
MGCAFGVLRLKPSCGSASTDYKAINAAQLPAALIFPPDPRRHNLTCFAPSLFVIAQSPRRGLFVANFDHFDDQMKTRGT